MRSNASSQPRWIARALPRRTVSAVVRSLEALGPAIVEEIIAYQRPNGYAYKMLSGTPVRDHVGTIELRRGRHWNRGQLAPSVYTQDPWS